MISREETKGPFSGVWKSMCKVLRNPSPPARQVWIPGNTGKELSLRCEGKKRVGEELAEARTPHLQGVSELPSVVLIQLIVPPRAQGSPEFL